MGLAIVPRFKPGVESLAFQAEGKLSFDEIQILDQIAVSAGLLAFTSFMDNRKIPDDFDGDPDDLDEIMGEWTDWFDPKDGLRTIETLIAGWTGEQKSADVDSFEYVLEQLSEYKRCLLIAQASGSKFRFEAI